MTQQPSNETSMNLTELKKNSVAELLNIAKEMGLDNLARSRKQDIIFAIQEDLIVGRKIKSTILDLLMIQGKIKTQKVAKSHFKIAGDKPLLKPISVLQTYSTYSLSRDKLLINSMLIDIHLLVSASYIILTENKTITQQEIVVVLCQINTDTGPQKQLFQISNRIIISVLDFIMPIELIIQLYVSKIDQPIAQITFLGVAQCWNA